MDAFLTSAFWPLLSLAGLSWLIARQLKVSPYVAPLSAMGTIVSLLFIADFAGLMRMTVIALLAIGLIAAVAALIELIRKPGQLSRRQAILLAVLAVGVLVLSHYNRHAALINWDEFSHWGTIVKITTLADTFHLMQQQVTYYFQDYPPGTALLAYFFLKSTGYNEPALFFSYSMILVAGCLPMIGLALSISYTRGLAAIVAAFVLIIVLGQGWSSVLIDQVVGVLFGGVICSYLVVRRKRPAMLLVLVPQLTFLVLSKQSGSSFFLVATAVVTIDQILRLWSPTPQSRRWASLAWLLPLWVVPQLFASGWTHYVRGAGLKMSFTNVSMRDAVSQMFGQCCQADREIVVMRNFFKELFGLPQALESGPAPFFHVLREQMWRPELFGHMFTHGHTMIAIALCATLVAGIAFHPRAERLRLTVMSAALVAAGAAFTAVLLVYYLYMFSDYEGRAVTSMTRYLHTYELGLALVAVGMLLSVPRAVAWKARIEQVVAVVALLGVASYAAPRLYQGAPGISSQRAQIREFFQPLQKRIPEHASIYVIWQGSNGFELWMSHYEVRPHNTNFDCYSVGPKKFDADIFSCNLSAETLAKSLATYDYVAVGQGMKSLQQYYPELFAAAPATDSGFFEVIKHNEKGEAAVLLRPFLPTGE